MKAIGNGNANLFWEHDLLPIQKPTKDSLPEDRRKFTQLKYQQRHYSNQHAQAHNKKMLTEVGFYSQTGLLLQLTHIGTQQRKCSVRWGFTVRLDYFSSQHI